MERLLSRNWTREHAQKRIDSQMPDSVKMEKADFVIINNGTLQELYSQCRILLRKLVREIEKEEKQ